MKKILLICFISMCAIVNAAEQTTAYKLVTVAQDITFENCTKIFSINNEKLFYLTLASVSANKFTIDEIQTANGYIIFTANKNKYLATIGKVDKDNSILKITPCNNIYFFPPGILLNIFKYIDINLDTYVKN